MSQFFLERGLVILREGRNLEFQHRSDTTLYFEDPFTGDITPLREDEFWREFECREIVIQKAISSPKELKIPEAKPDELPIPVNEKYRDKHLRILDYIAGIKRRDITRGQIALIEEAIPEIAKEINDLKPPKAMTVTEWMRKHAREGDDSSAVVPKHTQKLTRQRQHPTHEELIEKLMDDHLGKRPVAHIHERFYRPALAELNAERQRVGELPFNEICLRSFNRRFEALDRYEVAKAKYGRQEARRMFRMSKGRLPGDRPLEFVEIDHAKLRLWVVDDFLLLPIGRPWVTALKDRATKMMPGFFLSFRGPSLASTFSAIRHSLTPHLDLKKAFPDLEHDWVSFGQADTYGSDRGSDFTCPAYRYGIRQLGSEYSYFETRTAWHKGGLERTFFTAHADLLEAQPGEVYKGLAYCRDYNPKEDAVVRFSTLVFLFVKWAVDYQPYQRIRGIDARPIDLWVDGIADAPIAYPNNPDALNIILGRHCIGTLGHEGIRFKRLNYANDALEQLYQAIGPKSVRYVVCEQNLGRIHVEDPRERRWLEVDCTRPDYAEGLSLYQHDYLRRKASLEGQTPRDVDEFLRFRQVVQAHVAEDLARKDSATKARMARFVGIDSDAVFAGKPRSLGDLASAKPGSNPGTAQPVIPDAAFTDVPAFKWGIV